MRSKLKYPLQKDKFQGVIPPKPIDKLLIGILQSNASESTTRANHLSAHVVKRAPACRERHNILLSSRLDDLIGRLDQLKRPPMLPKGP